MNAYRQDVSQRREHTVGVGQGEYPAERERGDVGVAVDHAAAMASEFSEEVADGLLLGNQLALLPGYPTQVCVG